MRIKYTYKYNYNTNTIHIEDNTHKQSKALHFLSNACISLYFYVTEFSCSYFLFLGAETYLGNGIA
jgi:hypothetical protein